MYIGELGSYPRYSFMGDTQRCTEAGPRIDGRGTGIDTIREFGRLADRATVTRRIESVICTYQHKSIHFSRRAKWLFRRSLSPTKRTNQQRQIAHKLEAAECLDRRGRRPKATDQPAIQVNGTDA